MGSIGSYALVGMAAAVAASTHAPLMAAVLAFEVSGDYAVVLPSVATAVAAGLPRHERGFDLHRGPGEGVSGRDSGGGRRVADGVRKLGSPRFMRSGVGRRGSARDGMEGGEVENYRRTG